MKLIKKGIFFYISIFVLSTIMQSCLCREKQDVTIIGNGDLYIFQLDNSQRDTIRGEFRLSLHLELEYASIFKPIGIIPSAFATQPCDINLVNEIVQESIELKCDKDFNFKDELVEAGTNFLLKDGISFQVDDVEEGDGIVDVYLFEEFINDAEFSIGDHEFEIIVKTVKDETFMTKVSTYLELE